MSEVAPALELVEVLVRSDESLLNRVLTAMNAVGGATERLGDVSGTIDEMLR